MNNFYIAVDENAEDRVNTALKGQPFIANKDQFISLYNQGVINVSNPSITKIASIINEGYSNVILQNKKFYVSSAQETYIDKALFVLANWKLILTLKRIANDIVNDDRPADTKLIFFESKPGQVFLETDLEEDETRTIESFVKYDAAERFTSSKKAIFSNLLLKDKIQIYEELEDDNIFYIEAYDLIEIDSTFIEEINNIVDQRMKKD